MPAINRRESIAGIARYAPATREMKRARRRDAKLRRKIDEARESGDDKALARLCDIHARSYHSRLAAAGEMNRKRKKDQRFSPTRLVDIAANADPHDMTGRAITVTKGGKKRAAVDPSPRARVIQGVVSARLKPWMMSRLHPAQFVFQGGRQKACAKALEFMDGTKWAVALDVKDFYGTCDADALAEMVERELSLPAGMARAALSAAAMDLQPVAKKGGRPPRKPARQKRRFYLFNPKAARTGQTAGGEGKGDQLPKEGMKPSVSSGNVKAAPGDPAPCRDGSYPYSHSGSNADGSQPRRQRTKTRTKPTVCRRGLMLGSPASGLLAEWIISVVLKALPKSARVVCSADNVIVFVRTRKEATGVKQALTRSLAQGPAGSLTFGTRRIVKLTDGFEFLGYDFLTRRGVPTAVPTDENHRIILGRFHQRMKRRQYDKAQKCVEQWAAQFNLWPAMDDWTHHMLTNVDIAEAGYWESPDAIPRQGARPGEPLGADSPAGGEQPPRNFKSGA